jgi:NADPH-dependent ferric siderophore reductase
MMTAQASVIETVRLSARFHRVVMHVPELHRLTIPATADAAIGIYFRGLDSPGRTYTVRSYDVKSRQITVDFLLHGGGVGTDWIQRAAPADSVTLAHPNSWYQPPPTTESQLLVADLAGFPALARLIEELPTDTDAVAIVEVLDESDLDYLPPGRIEVVGSVGTGNGAGGSVLSRLVATRRPPAKRGYCWFGGEASEARAIRKYLRHELRWSVDQLDVMGYWRHDSETWDRRYASIGSALFDAYQLALAEGKDERVAAEEYDLALERLGL